MLRRHFPAAAALLLTLILFSCCPALAQEAPEEPEAAQAYLYLSKPNPDIAVAGPPLETAAQTRTAHADTAAREARDWKSRLSDAVKACGQKMLALARRMEKDAGLANTKLN